MRRLVTLANVAQCVSAKERFDANGTLFSSTMGQDERLYAVFSYGHHWPIAVFDRQRNVWFTHNDRYSNTTTRHTSAVMAGIPGNPYVVTKDQLINLISAVGDPEWLLQRAGSDVRSLVETAPLVDLLMKIDNKFSHATT